MQPDPDERELFALLGVDERAEWAQVRRAFRDAVRASHPDVHAGDPDAERRLKALNAAWASVNTPSKWAAFLLEPAGAARGAGPRTPAATARSSARLRVHRQRRGSAGLRNWKLELDGEVIAHIENGGTSLVQAGPGRHGVRVFYESCSSPRLEVELHTGLEVVLGCRQQEGLRASLFSPRRALVLELLDRRRFA